MSETDLPLLGRYARDRAEDAFAELVRRHLDLVYSSALRQVRSPQLAEEIAQSVFADLARAAHRIAPGTILTAWLYQVTRRTSVDVIRREVRRQWREQIATEMNATSATASDWTLVEPLLDDAMATLDETDRTAVLLRYFENKSLREVGQMLGTSDDAAQKRVSRAVERLREFFARQGMTVGAGGLTALIAANAVQAAPAGMAIAIQAVAASGGVAVATHTAMAWLNAKLIGAGLAATLAMGSGTYFLKEREARQLRQEIQQLAAQRQELAILEQASSDRITLLVAENEKLQAYVSESPRLRAEVATLRRQTNELSRLKADIVRLSNQITPEPDPAAARVRADLSEARKQICIENLRRLSGATEQYALENNLKVNDSVSTNDILPYLKDNPLCPEGGTYALAPIGGLPSCSFPGHSMEANH